MKNLSRFEKGIIGVLLLGFPFVLTNVNVLLGESYAIFSIIAVLFILLDNKRDIALKSESNFLAGSLLWGAGAYLLLVLAGTYIIIPSAHLLVSKLLAASTPALSNNVFLNKLLFGIFVGVSETIFFFVALYDFLADVVNVSIKTENLKTFKLWGLILFISFAFLAFHLTAKGLNVDAIPVLVLVFFMSVISLVLVTIKKDAMAAIFFHCIANSISVGLIPGFGT